MAEQLPGILFDNVKAPHPKVDAESAYYYLEFDKTEEYFSYYENEMAFYKGVESLVRKHQFMRNYYPKYLKEVIGLRTCEVMPGIEADDKNKKITIEMHHFPLTLFDVCMIVTNYFRSKGRKDITTFQVAKEVVEQHRLNNIRIVMLSKSVHAKVHDEDIFINYRQGFGDMIRFIELFKEGIDKDMRMKINKYIGWSIDHDSQDNNILQLASTMREWGNNDFGDYDSMDLD